MFQMNTIFVRHILSLLLHDRCYETHYQAKPILFLLVARLKTYIIKIDKVTVIQKNNIIRFWNMQCQFQKNR